MGVGTWPPSHGIGSRGALACGRRPYPRLTIGNFLAPARLTVCGCVRAYVRICVYAGICVYACVCVHITQRRCQAASFHRRMDNDYSYYARPLAAQGRVSPIPG